MKHAMQIALAFGLIAAIPTVPAWAQERDRATDDGVERASDRADRARNRDADRSQRDRQRTDQARSDDPRRPEAARDFEDRERSARGGSRPVIVAPGGWVTVFVDYDGDGRIDGRESLYYFDLLSARNDSRQRRAREQVRRPAPPRRPQQEIVQLQGTIQEQAEFELTGHEAKFVVARINTENEKTARVVLGMREDLEKLNLDDGSQVNVKGERRLINNKPVVFASMVTSQGKVADVSPPRARSEQRVRGTIQSVEERSFRGRDGEFLVADVELASGRTRTINLGPKARLEALQLSEGDEVRVLARNGRINGRSALIAAQVHAKDRTIGIPRSRMQADKSTDRRSETGSEKPRERKNGRTVRQGTKDRAGR